MYWGHWALGALLTGLSTTCITSAPSSQAASQELLSDSLSDQLSACAGGLQVTSSPGLQLLDESELHMWTVDKYFVSEHQLWTSLGFNILATKATPGPLHWSTGHLIR